MLFVCFTVYECLYNLHTHEHINISTQTHTYIRLANLPRMPYPIQFSNLISPNSFIPLACQYKPHICICRYMLTAQLYPSLVLHIDPSITTRMVMTWLWHISSWWRAPRTRDLLMRLNVEAPRALGGQVHAWSIDCTEGPLLGGPYDHAWTIWYIWRQYAQS